MNAFLRADKILMRPIELMKWKTAKAIAADGNAVDLPTPELISRHYRGTLAYRISEMRKLSPISFEKAIQLIHIAEDQSFSEGRIGYERGEYFWFVENFLEFVADLGFHIELTGDEFEVLDLDLFNC